MNSRHQSWSSLLRNEGPDFLEWLESQSILPMKIDFLAKALSTLLRKDVRTPQQANDVWTAVPAVLSRCNDNATYKMPGAAQAYAWLHLLD